MARPALVTAVLDALAAPFGAVDGPTGPTDSPALWVVLAAVRRQFGLSAADRDTTPLAASTQTSQPLVAAAAANTPPTAVNDSATIIKNTTKTFTAAQLVGNDTDPDGGTLAVNNVGSAVNGVVTLNANGTVAFTPTANFTGAASFNYRVKDAAGAVSTNVSKVTVTVVANAAPTAVNDGPVTVTKNTAKTFTAAQLVGNDTDPNQDDVLKVNSVGSAVNGTVKLNADGSVTFTPTANYTGTASFNYRVKDAAGAVSANVATVGITVRTNDAPTAVNDADTIGKNAPRTYTVAELVGNDTDPDAPYELFNYTPRGDTLSVNSVGSVVNGTVVLNSNGTVTFTPTANYTGAASFNYRVKDAAGATSSNVATVSLTVTSSTQSLAPVNGVAVGPVVMGSTGAKYQIVAASSQNGVEQGPSRVQVVAPDGSVTTTNAIAGAPVTIVAAAGGNAYLTTYDQATNITRLSVITPTGGVVTAAPITGSSASPLIVSANGTAYLTTFVSGPMLSDFKVTLMRPDGATATYSYQSRGGGSPVVLGADGTAYTAYTGSDNGVRVLVLPPNGFSRTSAPIYGAFVGVVAGSNAAYLTVYDATFTATTVSVINATTTTTRAILGQQAFTPVVLGPNNTAYQVTSPSNNAGTTYVSVITPAGITTTQGVAGTPPGGFPTRSPMKVAADGTAYVPLGTFGMFGFGNTVMVVSPTGAVKVVQLDRTIPYFDDGLWIGPDNNAYVQTAYQIEKITPAGVKTVVPVADEGTSGAAQTGVVFTQDGTASVGVQAFRGGSGDSFYYIKNVTTGTESVEVPADANSAGPLVVGPDGTLFWTFTAYNTPSAILAVKNGAVRANGSLPPGEVVGPFIDGPRGGNGGAGPGPVFGPDGTAYYTVVESDEVTDVASTRIVAVNALGARVIATRSGRADGGVTVGQDGKLYLSTTTTTGTSSKTQVHVITPTTLI